MIRLGISGGIVLAKADGSPLEYSSRKGLLVLAMLATAPGQERTRGAVQECLWGSRGRAQAMQSLRRELVGLRRLLGDALITRSDRLQLAPGSVELVADWPEPGRSPLADIQLPGEPGFVQWRLSLQKPGAQPRSDPPEPPEPGIDSGPLTLLVMPIENRTSDPALDPTCTGLTDDLIDRISRLRWLPVMARGTSFSSQINAASIERLGVRYVLNSSIQRNLGGLRYVARLVDHATGLVKWSNAVVLPDPPTSVRLYDMIDGLVANIGARIDHEEQRRVLTKRPEDLAVSDLVWLGRWHFHRLSPRDMNRSADLFEEAIRREPTSAEAHLNHAWGYLFETWRRRGSAEEIGLGLVKARRAVELEELDSRGHFLIGAAKCWLGQTDEAEQSLRHAISLNPSCFHAYGQLGSALYLDGRPDQGLEMMTKAARISPYDQQLFFVLTEIGMAHLMLGNAEEALQNASRATVLRPGYWYAHAVRAAALRELGREAEACAALDQLYDTKCNFKPAFIEWLPFRDRSWNSYLARMTVHQGRRA